MLQDALAGAGYPERVLVACSGGPDSLALAAVAAYFARRGHVDGHPVSVGAVVVDHQLQPGSAGVAAATAATLRDLGLSPVQIRTVDVASTGMGPEAAARDARHAALEAAADDTGAGAILLGHTLDDQAEQVLLGLARGSGTRSLAGMRPARGRLLRPFLGLRRADTLEICEVEGLDPWHDPEQRGSRVCAVPDPGGSAAAAGGEAGPGRGRIARPDRRHPAAGRRLPGGRGRTTPIVRLREQAGADDQPPGGGPARTGPGRAGSGSSPRPRPPSEASSPATSACSPRKRCSAGRGRPVPWSSPAGSASTGSRSPSSSPTGQPGRRRCSPRSAPAVGSLYSGLKNRPEI